eukprot:scaffold2991_cov250-Pinguiococcus_pyrenoidosus.AAC.6
MSTSAAAGLRGGALCGTASSSVARAQRAACLQRTRACETSCCERVGSSAPPAALISTTARSQCEGSCTRVFRLRTPTQGETYHAVCLLSNSIGQLAHWRHGDTLAQSQKALRVRICCQEALRCHQLAVDRGSNTAPCGGEWSVFAPRGILPAVNCASVNWWERPDSFLGVRGKTQSRRVHLKQLRWRRPSELQVSCPLLSGTDAEHDANITNSYSCSNMWCISCREIDECDSPVKGVLAVTRAHIDNLLSAARVALGNVSQAEQGELVDLLYQAQEALCDALGEEHHSVNESESLIQVLSELSA